MNSKYRADALHVRQSTATQKNSLVVGCRSATRGSVDCQWAEPYPTKLATRQNIRIRVHSLTKGLDGYAKP